MGFGGISIWQLVIVLAIVVMLFGTKKLRNMGGDLGSAIKGFKKAMDAPEAGAEKDKEAEKLEEPKKEASSEPAQAEQAESSADKK